MLARINRPASGVKLEQIISGVKGIPGVIIQTVFVDGEVTNTRGEPFETWLSALAGIKPAGQRASL
jgi:hypothetical protein